MPSLAASNTVAGIRRLGLRPENVTHLLVTHIHLDHSGGAWRWAREFGTTICVHPRGAPHIENPGKLVASATKIFGADMPRLWGEVQAVPPERQFPRIEGLDAPAVLSHRCGPGGALVLRQAKARVCGLTLLMKVSGVRGYPAQLDLQRAEGDSRQFPADLLEVQGRAWTRLEARRQGWEASVQLRGSEPQRSADAEARLAQTLQHLQRTLSEPPVRFHQRHRAARWRVGLSRAGPLMLGVLLVAAAFAVRGRGGAGESALAALANLAPPLLMALFFMRREMPRIELPRLPRAPAAGSWLPWPAST